MGKGLFNMWADVAVEEIFYFFGEEVSEEGFSDCSVLGPEYFSGGIDGAHNIEVARGVVSGAVKFLLVLDVPDVAVTLAVAGTCFPKVHLIGPVGVSDEFVSDNEAAEREAGDVCEGVLLDEVVPEEEGWSDSFGVEVVVPFLEEGNNLVALFSDTLFWEE